MIRGAGATTPSAVTSRDPLGSVALGAAALSLLGFAVLVIGHLVAPATFNAGKHAGAADYVAFYAYVLGLLVAIVLGGAVWIYGRRSGRTGRSLAGLAAGYGAVALIVGIVIAALGG